MIIKLKNADFSANNIGQVQVTTDLDDFTKAAIIASGNENLSPETKSALNDLFLAMGVDGSNQVMSKMRYVFLPMIAGDVAHALINYNSDSFVNEKTLTSTYWTIRNHGLIGVSNDDQHISLSCDNPLVTNNFCSLFLRTEKMVNGASDLSYVITYRGKTNTSLFLGPSQLSISSNTRIGFGTYGCDWGDVNIEKSNDVAKTNGVNYSQTNYEVIFGGNYYKITPLPTITSDMSNETSQTVYVCGLNSNNLTKPYGAIINGEAISTEEFNNIANKLDALYSTLQ